MGRVAEELGEIKTAKENYLQALNLWGEYGDRYSVETYSLPALKRLYDSTGDEGILAAMESWEGEQ